MDSKKPVRGYSGPYRGKNDYYRDGAHILMFIVKFEAIVMAVLTIALSIYLCTRHNKDNYLAETVEGRVMPMISWDHPNMGRPALSDWAAKAASDIMTVGFNDVEVRFAQSRKNFTAEGWESFRKAMILSKLPEDVEKTQQIATAVPRSPPTLSMEGLINGKYSWVIDVPLLITFRAGSDIKPTPKRVHMVIEKMPTAENPNGVGISEWNIY